MPGQIFVTQWFDVFAVVSVVVVAVVVADVAADVVVNWLMMTMTSGIDDAVCDGTVVVVVAGQQVIVTLKRLENHFLKDLL